MQRVTLSMSQRPSAAPSKTAGKERSPRPAALSSVDEVLRTPGSELDPSTRRFMEPRFHHDFSRVRVHADTQAANSARAVNALAYTVGGDLVFGNGQYAPHTSAGRRLLAHELAHTVQQAPAAAPALNATSLPISHPDDASERQAAAAADQIVGSRSDSIHASAPPALNAGMGVRLQREPDGKGPESAQQQLEKTVRDAAAFATQKVEQEGLAKMRDHVPTVPEPRRVTDTTRSPQAPPHAPPENLRPNPFDVEADPVKTAAPNKPAASASKTAEPDRGTAEHQLAVGPVVQSDPGQGGVAIQAAFQDKHIVASRTIPFLKYFQLQLGVLQPTLTVQLAHIAPFKPAAASKADPLPAPDSAQFSATFSPAVVKIGDKVTLAPQIGVASVVSGDVFNKTKGPGKSGEHVQALGIVNLQIDYSLSDRVSVTGSAGFQEGVDSGPLGNRETHAFTGSVFATFHFK